MNWAQALIVLLLCSTKLICPAFLLFFADFFNLRDKATAIDQHSHRRPAEPSNCSPYNWTSVPMTTVGSSNFQHAATFSYTIPYVIPSNAREVLVHAGFYTGLSNNGPLQYLKIFTQIETNRYEQYLMVFSYPQNAFNTNSDNMWFPMPPNRLVHLTVPAATGKNSGVRLFVIGYR